MILKTLIFFLLIFSTAHADDCTVELLLSNSWQPFHTSDIYTLKKNGDLNCFNEHRHRNECDYVYMSDYQGVPDSWELIRADMIKITFKQGMFSKKNLELSCEFIPAEEKLKVGNLELTRLDLYKK